MGWKGSANENVHLIECPGGAVPTSPSLQPMRYVSCGLEGSVETIENDSKLAGRNPGKSFPGKASSAGDLQVNFAPLEHDKLLEAVFCSENGFEQNAALSDATHDVFDMVPGNKQRVFALLKEFTQDPKLYQLFTGVQVNTLSISFEIGSLVKLTFGLMGANNALLEDTPPVSMSGKLPLATTTEFITLSGSWKLKMPGDAAPVEYIDGISISLEVDNEMTDLQGLFQTEAIDKSIGMLRITGTISELLHDLEGQGKGGKLYNLAKQGGDAELYITLKSEKDDAEYEFILKIGLDNSTLDDGDNITASIPFKTYGADRFILRKTVPAAVTP